MSSKSLPRDIETLYGLPNLHEASIATQDTELYMVDFIEIDSGGRLKEYSVSYLKIRPGIGDQYGVSGIKSRYSDDYEFVHSGYLDRHRFIDDFCLLEILSITILSIHYGKDIHAYGEMCEVFSKMSFSERLKFIKKIWLEHYPRRANNLLQLRNKIAHSLESQRFIYNNRLRISDESLNNEIRDDMRDSAKCLLQILDSQNGAINQLKNEILNQAEARR